MTKIYLFAVGVLLIPSSEEQVNEKQEPASLANI
jgi:hypothetical protein